MTADHTVSSEQVLELLASVDPQRGKPGSRALGRFYRSLDEHAEPARATVIPGTDLTVGFVADVLAVLEQHEATRVPPLTAESLGEVLERMSGLLAAYRSSA
ncbi:hypothetical protein [Kutzneria albida]|uniref:Uncharacterized protein n=1 Tax=Kutzneria albida DSM 43870 TaxID=1449976 RepID=W5WAQ9_9PSEU|nr:hypothetical protein [Kutzneria albida]AHH98203.1 hypothetical protein KALB_4841 [Kutzneria albida DSM 43870]